MQFYCTAGRGTESFVAGELKRIFSPHLQVATTDGKIYFSVDNGTDDLHGKLMSLKTVERLFVQVLHENFEKLDRRGLLTLLHTKLQHRALWDDSISTLKCLEESVVLNVKNVVEESSSAVLDANNVVEESSSAVLYANNVVEESSSAVLDANNVVEESSSAVLDANNVVEESSSAILDANNMVEESSSEVLDANNVVEESSSAVLDANNMLESSCPVRKKRKLENDGIVTFRVSCRFSGAARKLLNIQRTSHQMGVLISKLLGWKIDLRHPKHEINIYLSDDTFAVGIPVTRVPLSKRTYIKHSGLRSPIAWIMADLLGVQPGHVVLDPMCGVATILMEATHLCQGAVYIGMDRDISQLHLAAENIIHNTICNCTMLMQGDTRHISLPDNSIDAVVTDAPFGQNHTVSGDIHEFYVQLLSEIARVVKPGSKIVLLASCNMINFLKQISRRTDTPACSSRNESFPEVASHVGEDIVKSSENEKPRWNKHDSCETEATDACYDFHNQDTGVRRSECKSGDSKLWPLFDSLPLMLCATYDVKLGETQGCIFVLQTC